MKLVLQAVLTLTVVSSLGCVSRFSKVAPGMTADEVTQAMESAPHRVFAFQDNYTSWYYDGDGCLLLQNNQVIGKDENRKQTGVHTPVGGFSSVANARCVPPGQDASPDMEHRVVTPFGGVRVQGSR